MVLLGVITQAVVFVVLDASSQSTITLRDLVVVKNLGQDLLIGEPGKKDNDIITMVKDNLKGKIINNLNNISFPSQ